MATSGVSYKVYRSTTGAFPAQDAMLLTTTASLSHTDTSLPTPRAERYYYAVSTVSNGVEGRAAVTTVEYPFAPGQPQLSKLSDNSYKVSWPASPRTGVTYNLYRAEHQGFVPGPATIVRTGITTTEVFDPRNMAKNGSFETSLTGNWEHNYGSSVDSAEAKFGTKSIRLTVNFVGAGSTHSAQTMTRRDSGPVTVSGWSKAISVTGSPNDGYALKATAQDSQKTVIASGYAAFSTGSHDWQKLQFTLNPPAGIEYALTVSVVLNGSHAGTAWFDGIQVEQGAVATDYSDYLDATSVVYRVTAVDGELESSPSVEGVPSVASSVLPPGAVTPQQLGGDLVSVSWQPSPTPGVTYEVKRRACDTCQLLLVARGLTGTSFTDGVNKIPDASFETNTNPPWSSGCTATPDCPRRSSGGRTGSYAISMSQTQCCPEMSSYQRLDAGQSQALPMTLSAYGRASGVALPDGEKFSVEVVWYDVSGVTMGSSVLNFDAGTYGWVRKSTTFTPPRPIRKVRLDLKFSGTGTAFFDDLQLEQGTTAADWQEGMTGSTLQYFVSAEKNGVLSPASIAQSIGRYTGIPTPIDVAGRDLGAGFAELTWTPHSGTTYAVQRAPVDANGSAGTYVTVGSGLTGGSYRPDKNLVYNSGFEQVDSSNRLIGWTGGRPSGGVIFLYRSSTTDEEAIAYQDITVNQSSVAPFTVSASSRSCGVSGAPGDGYSVRLELRDAAGTLVGSGIKPLNRGCDWVTASLTVTPITPAYTARVSLVLTGASYGSTYFDNVQLEPGTANTGWVDDQPVNPGTYVYRVLPTDTGGGYGAASPTVTVKVTGVPQPVTNLRVTPGSSQMTVAWTGSTTPNVTYNVYRRTDGKRPTAGDRIAGNVTATGFIDHENLITNSGFDRDDDGNGIPDGWSVLAGTPGDRDSADVKFGPASYRLTRSSTQTGTPQTIRTIAVLNQGQASPVTFSLYSKAALSGSTGRYVAAVELLDIAGRNVGTGTLDLSTSVAAWERPSITVSPTGPAQTATVTVSVEGGLTGSAWVDGIQLHPGSVVGDWTEGPVEPGRTFYYTVGTVDRYGKETMTSSPASAMARPWVLATELGDAPGLGLDDRWAFVDLPVPGGQVYVNLRTGNLVILATDSVIPGPRLAQVIRRTYNSLGGPATGSLGVPGWSLNVAQTLRLSADLQQATLTEGDGTELQFTKQGTSYVAPPSVWMSLSAGSGPYSWKIIRRDGIVYWFSGSGSTFTLAKLTEPNGNAITYELNATGRPVTLTDSANRSTRLVYDGANRLSSVLDAGGRNYSYLYDTSGRLSAVQGPSGATFTYGYDLNGRLGSITDGEGRKVVLTYDAQGRFSSYAWEGAGGTTAFTYGGQVGAANSDVGRTDIQDGEGNITSFLTNRTGQKVEARDALGNVTHFDYDAQKRLTRISNPRGLITEIEYEDPGLTPRVSRVTHADGISRIVTSYDMYSAYDKPGRIIDPMGVETRFSFDAAGNVREEITGANVPELAAITQHFYKPSGMPDSSIDAEGNVTRYGVNQRGEVTSITNPVNGITTMNYDDAGNLSSVTDPNGNTTTHTFDGQGRRTSTTYPDGSSSSWSYDRSGLLVEEVRPGGMRFTYQYDRAGRPIAQIDPTGAATRFTYDLAGNQMLTFWPNGSLERREYDAVGRLVRTYNGENLTGMGTPVQNALFTEYAYDSVGNLVWARLPGGYTVSAEYDLFNRLTSEVRPPATTKYTYNPIGQVLSVTDGNGNLTKYDYDLLGRLTRVTDATNFDVDGNYKPGVTDPVATSYGYDKLNRRTWVKDARGKYTRYTYHPLGMVAQETDPLGQMVLNTYDLAGQLLSSMDRNGNSTSYLYDQMGRITKVMYQNDCDEVEYRYGAGGRRLTMTDNQGVTQYQYDQAGRLAVEQGPTGTLRYEYDASGLRTAMHLAGGAIRYDYDRANRVKRVTDVAGSVTTVGYDANGNIQNLSLPGGAAQVNVYDPTSNRLTQRHYTGAGTLSYTYTYDTVGNLLAVDLSDRWGAQRTERITYEYDQLHRLKVQTLPQSMTTYTYDATGNRLTEVWKSLPATPTQTTSTTTYEYNDAGWLTKSTNVTDTNTVVTQYAHDGQGNLVQVINPDNVERYTYDSRGLLIQSQSNREFTYNAYDGDGRRISRKVVALQGTGRVVETTTKSGRYQYDGVSVVSELDGANSLRTAYARLPGGRLLSWFKPGSGTIAENSGAILADHLGSVVQMVRAKDGAEVNSYDYDAFGKVRSSSETIANDLKFTGAPMDSNGLHHLYARFYNSSVGRFITQDTWKGDPWQPWTQNLYVYVGNNPVNYVDPTGHCPVPSATETIELGMAWWSCAIDMSAGSLLMIANSGMAMGLGETGVRFGQMGDTLASELSSPSTYNGSKAHSEAPELSQGGARVVTAENPAVRNGSGASAHVDFVVTPGGTAIPVPDGATGPGPVVNKGGNTTGFAYVGGKGGANGQVSQVRIMDSTPPRGRSPGYPNGYVVYMNDRRQAVDPVTGRTLSDMTGHYRIE